jgi:hypothetical protein
MLPELAEGQSLESEQGRVHLTQRAPNVSLPEHSYELSSKEA